MSRAMTLQQQGNTAMMMLMMAVSGEEDFANDHTLLQKHSLISSHTHTNVRFCHLLNLQTAEHARLLISHETLINTKIHLHEE